MGRLEPYYKDKRTLLYNGDCREVMATLPENYVHSIITDPPYELNFMGKTWDRSGVAYDPDTWRQALRVARPGAHLAAFGAPRTYHRIAVAIEDAGWEIRDCLMWMFGTGFPKGLNVSKAFDKAAGAERKVIGHLRPNNVSKDHAIRFNASPSEFYELTAPSTDEAIEWDGWNTVLKPAFEPIILARKKLDGTMIQNIKKWGCGPINIEATRIGTDGGRISTIFGPMGEDEEQLTYGRGLGRGIRGQEMLGAGRWPANVILDEEAAAILDEEVGSRRGGYATGGESREDQLFAFGNDRGSAPRGYGDRGGPSRFFYTAKASRYEREDGLGGKKGKRENVHSTVKPVSLMAWLIQLLTPPDGVVMDPFLGSGSTRMAAHLEGKRCIGIELSEEYLRIAQSRTAGVVGPLVPVQRANDAWVSVFGKPEETGVVVGRPRLED